MQVRENMSRHILLSLMKLEAANLTDALLRLVPVMCCVALPLWRWPTLCSPAGGWEDALRKVKAGPRVTLGEARERKPSMDPPSDP